jgi:hypothetical protein
VNLYRPGYFDYKSEDFDGLAHLDKGFIICQEILAKQIDADYEANLACSTIKKQAQLVKKTYFNTCYLLAPMANHYSCV